MIMILGKLSMPEGSKGKKKSKLPGKKKSMQEEIEADLEMPADDDSLEQEEMPAEGDEEMLDLEEGAEGVEEESPLASLSDDELLEELRKRGLEA